MSSEWSMLPVLLLLLILDATVYGFSSAVHALKPPFEADEETAGNGDAGTEQGRSSAAGSRGSPESRMERRRRLVRKALKDQSDYIDTIQLVTACISMIVGGIIGVTAAAGIRQFLVRVFPDAGARPVLTVLSAVLAWIVVLYVLLVFGVQIPKRLGAAHPDRWVSRCGPVFLLLMTITLPLTRLVSLTAKGILYVFGVRGTHLQGDVTEEEIRSIVNEGHEQGVLDQSEAEMITNIFEFSDKEASDIMTPRGDMVSIDGTERLGSAITFMLEQHNSRFPVYQDNIDNITGILHFRDAVRWREEHPGDEDQPVGSLAGLLREAVFVPETKDIDDLFRQMQKKKLQMVIVIDEYGQTSGLIAMEDILEEIVGNIMDEYDVDENHIVPTGNRNEFIVDGRTPLEELTRRFGIEFHDDRFETVNGFLMAQMDHVPDESEHFTTDYGGYRFHVLSVANRQVQKALMTKLKQQKAAQENTDTRV